MTWRKWKARRTALSVLVCRSRSLSHTTNHTMSVILKQNRSIGFSTADFSLRTFSGVIRYPLGSPVPYVLYHNTEKEGTLIVNSMLFL